MDLISLFMIISFILFVYFLIRFLKNEVDIEAVKRKKQSKNLVKSKIGFICSGFFVVFVICGLFFGWLIGAVVAIVSVFVGYHNEYNKQKIKESQ